MTQDTWTLGITKDQFDYLYGDRIDSSLFNQPPQSNDELVNKHLMSKLWRLNNLYTIVNKRAQRIKFLMNYAQHVVYAASLIHPRLIILKSRQQGISTFWLISYFDDAITIPDYNIGLMAQGLDESATLLKRVKVAWEAFPPVFKAFFGIVIIRDNTSEIALSNGSTIFIRTSFRSTTLMRLHISEYGKIANKNPERAIEIKTGTLQAIQAGHTIAIESTAEGDNDFKRSWDKAIEAEMRMIRLGTGKFSGKDFKPIFLSWVDDPDCVSAVYEQPNAKQLLYFEQLEYKLKRTLSVEQKNFWIAQYRELDERIYQEYPATPEEAFTKLNEGSFYGALYLKLIVKQQRILPDLYEVNLEVNVAMDLGISESDVFTLVYFQRYDDDYRIIAEYTNYGEGLAHYVNHMKETGYRINVVVAPHDIKVKELGTGKTRFRILQELGVTNILVLNKTAIIDGIEAVRQLMPNIWIDESCEYLQKCFKNYAREWDENKGTWKSKANHDQWSHGADALRYMAMAGLRRKKAVQRRRNNNVYDGIAF